MQGLGALEFVLYGTGAEALDRTGEPYRCHYGAAIAGNLDDDRRRLSTPPGLSRTALPAQWAHPGPGNPLYRDRHEAVTELVDVFVNGLELVRDVRLGGFLGEQAAGRQAEAGDLLALATARRARWPPTSPACRRCSSASGLGEALPPDTRWIAESITSSSAMPIAAADAATAASPRHWPIRTEARKLVYFSVVTSSLSELFGTRLSASSA